MHAAQGSVARVHAHAQTVPPHTLLTFTFTHGPVVGGRASSRPLLLKISGSVPWAIWVSNAVARDRPASHRRRPCEFRAVGGRGFLGDLLLGLWSRVSGVVSGVACSDMASQQSTFKFIYMHVCPPRSLRCLHICPLSLKTPRTGMSKQYARTPRRSSHTPPAYAEVTPSDDACFRPRPLHVPPRASELYFTVHAQVSRTCFS